MALTLTKLAEVTEDGARIVYGTITPDASHAAGGETFDTAAIGLTRLQALLVGNVAGYSISWNGSTSAPKVDAYMGDNDAVADGAFVEASTKDLSALTIPFIAIGI